MVVERCYRRFGCEIIHPTIDIPESSKQMEEKLNFQVPAEGLELVILLHTQY